LITVFQTKKENVDSHLNRGGKPAARGPNMGRVNS